MAITTGEKVGSAAEEVDLSEESFGGLAMSRQEALGRGVLIDVSSWAQREMGLAEAGQYRISVAVSIRLWRGLHQMPELIRRFCSVQVRGQNVLWAAAYALRQARQLGYSYAEFWVELPTGGAEDRKQLRVERCVHDDGRPALTIGFADEER